MKKHILDFLHRGLVACGFGPIVLAILYLILKREGVVEVLTINEVCIGIFSLFALAFISGAMNAIYQIERIPLMIAILIHGSVLYISYLGTYLLNDWLERNTVAILVFSGIFVVGYLVIWTIIYFIMKKRTNALNMILKKKQQIITGVDGDAKGDNK